MPELAQRCIESWRKYLPDYELRLWNEDTFDLDLYPYAREAYDNRKYAFVTDVVRLWALEQFGGVTARNFAILTRGRDPRWS